MIGLILFGLIVGLSVAIYDRKMYKIDHGYLAKFLFWMFFMSFFRLTLVELSGSASNNPMNNIKLANFWLVFWEDMCFSMPIYYILFKFNIKKYISYPIVFFICLLFGLLHFNPQGLYAVLVLSPMPLVMARVARTKGFGTTIIIHIMYDLFTVLVARMAVYMVL